MVTLAFLLAAAISLAGGMLGAEKASAADPVPLKVTIPLMTADSASVTFPALPASQTWLIRKIIVFADNGGVAGVVYVGIHAADGGTRLLWYANSIAASARSFTLYDNINLRLTPAQAAAGVNLFIFGASTDTLFAEAEVERVGL